MLLRAAFFTLLAGGLLLWGELRRPRELPVTIDLTAMTPGEISEIDAIVRRGGHVLGRHQARFGGDGAPGTLKFMVRAAPGDAEMETTLVYPGKGARRTIERIKLE
ncbi:MAG TPA: hypothetical protein VLW85_18035 [Myxococcales bacterium]|nr:hypothetical protein [Myxococcales bacterium]